MRPSLRAVLLKRQGTCRRSDFVYGDSWFAHDLHWLHILHSVFHSLCPFRIPDDSALILMGCFGGTLLKVPCADIIDLQSFQSLKVMENDVKLLAPLFTTRDTPWRTLYCLKTNNMSSKIE